MGRTDRLRQGMVNSLGGKTVIWCVSGVNSIYSLFYNEKKSEVVVNNRGPIGLSPKSCRVHPTFC